MAGFTNQDERVEVAVKWAIQTANDDSHGYDQANRLGPDYDCSSFVATALSKGGFNINPATITTHNMGEKLTSLGFSRIGYKQGFELSRGDIVINPNHHVVLMLNNYECVSASINEKGTTTGGETGDQTGKEIYIRSLYQPSYGWLYIYRYTFHGAAISDLIFSMLPVLRQGATGEIVKVVQVIIEYKMNKYLEIDGIFGTETRKAVYDWQIAHGLEADGIVGRFTWLSLINDNK